MVWVVGQVRTYGGLAQIKRSCARRVKSACPTLVAVSLTNSANSSNSSNSSSSSTVSQFHTPPELVALALFRHVSGGVEEYQAAKQDELKKENVDIVEERRKAGFKALNFAAKWHTIPQVVA